MKKFLGATLLAGMMLFNTAAAAPAHTTHNAHNKNRETIYQIALLQSKKKSKSICKEALLFCEERTQNQMNTLTRYGNSYK